MFPKNYGQTHVETSPKTSPKTDLPKIFGNLWSNTSLILYFYFVGALEMEFGAKVGEKWWITKGIKEKIKWNSG